MLRLPVARAVGVSSAGMLTTATGPLVRIGPNEVLSTDPDVLRMMSAARSPYTKGLFYETGRIIPGEETVVSLRDEPQHKALRAKMGTAVCLRISSRRLLPAPPSSRFWRKGQTFWAHALSVSASARLMRFHSSEERRTRASDLEPASTASSRRLSNSLIQSTYPPPQSIGRCSSFGRLPSSLSMSLVISHLVMPSVF